MKANRESAILEAMEGGAHKLKEATGVSLQMFFKKGLNGCEESSHLFEFVVKGFGFFFIS